MFTKRTNDAHSVNFREAYEELMKVYPFTLENLPNEIWQNIEGYDGIYQVSTYGRVKSFCVGKAKVLKPGIRRNGYLFMRLFKDGKINYHSVHRLVAIAFLPAVVGKEQVNHRDGVKFNNCVENLEWVNNSENQRHAYAIGIKSTGEDNTLAKLKNADVIYIRENPDGLTCKELASVFGVGQATIGDVQLGKYYKNVGGKIRKSLRRRLTTEQRDEIKRLYQKGVAGSGIRTLGKMFGCNPTTILKIVNEKIKSRKSNPSGNR